MHFVSCRCFQSLQRREWSPILVLDRRLSKKTENILFAKIENDRYGLGAQRRAIEKNDRTLSPFVKAESSAFSE